MKSLVFTIVGVVLFAGVASAQQREISQNMATEIAYVKAMQNPPATQAAKPAAGAPAAPAATSLAGTWNMMVEVPQQGPLPNTLVLKLDGKTVTGTIASHMYGS